MDFLPAEISAYADAHTSVLDMNVLNELERETHLNVLMPQMLSGSFQGQFLAFISNIIRPKTILEIGTYTGYSAICLAQGLAEDGILHTIDINAELEDMVNSYISKAGLQDKVKTYVGNAIDLIPTIEGPYDLVFIDADKVNYPNYYDMVFDKVPVGGSILVDNVLWSGKVAQDKKDKKTAAIDLLNKKALNDERVKSILLPIRDGVLWVQKLKA